MKIFYIYHVQGHKVGCTSQKEKRFRENFQLYQTEPVVLETIKGPDTPEFWQIVGDREWELADLYGYSRGVHYKIATEARRRGAAKGGRAGKGKTVTFTEEAKNNMRLGHYKRTDNIVFKRSSAGGKASRKLTDQEVNEILILRDNGLTLKQISERYNVGINTISRRCRGINYK
jgi:transposase